MTNAGLCGACRYRREIRSRRGSSFLLCRRSLTDPRFRRYPPLPVLSCPGFEKGVPAETGEPDDLSDS
ncbi:MAG: hypothetical protein EA350_09155 [Gemmatimonadales bacterium]|nr:MAG: hypothetical protein EA350_09155 [Gemmatimonadales bacterium]